MIELFGNTIFEATNSVINIIKDSINNINKPTKTHNFELKERVKHEGIFIPFGLDNNGKTLYLNLKENPHTYIVGTTGSGKSVCVKSIITSLSANYKKHELELELLDLKRVELNLFKNLDITNSFVYKLDDVKSKIKEILNECEHRFAKLMNTSVTSIFDYNKIQGVKKMKYKVVFIEEIVLLLQDKKHEAMTDLIQLLSISRACGIYVFITTQRPSADILAPSVKVNISNRIVFKVDDIKNSVICLDEEGAENLRGKGHGIFKLGSIKKEFNSFYISDEKIHETLKSRFIIEKNKTKITSKGFIENKEKETYTDDISFLDKL